jgi:TonB family protein
MQCLSHSTLVIVLVAAACAPGAQFALGSPSEHRTSCAGKLSGDSTVYDESEVSEPPERRSGPIPEYPWSAMKEGVQGTVLVAVIIEPTGKVQESSLTFVVRVDPRLDESAARLLRKTTFWPGCRAGLAVRVHVIMPVSYAVRR